MFTFRTTIWTPQPLPRLMGILNVTPDSFSDGGEFFTVDDAVARGVALAEAGADVIDIGGESTRPGAEPVSEAEELRRVVPVIERLSTATEVPISIDTTKAGVARAALAAGAAIVNDISGLTFDPEMIDVCVESDAGVIAMHIKGTPQTMQDDPTYGDCLAEVTSWLEERVRVLSAAGIAEERIMLDPGIGFGKTAAHNLELLAGIATLKRSGRPVLIGHSRKRFLKRVLGREIEERLAGTIGVSLALADQGADLLRVHDVRAVGDALRAREAIRSRVVS